MEFVEAAVVAIEDRLLKVFGVGTGEVFPVPEGHLVSFYVAVAALFFFLPAPAGPALEQVIEAVAPAIVEQFFEGGLDEGCGNGARGFF